MRCFWYLVSTILALFAVNFDAPLGKKKNDGKFTQRALCPKAETIRKRVIKGHKMKTLPPLHVRCTLAKLYFGRYCKYAYARSTRFSPSYHFHYFTDFMRMQVVIEVTRTLPSSSIETGGWPCETK